MIVRTAPLLVVGSGVAGLTVALTAPAATVLTPGRLGGDGSSAWAQGGIAAAVGPGDGPGCHADDTRAVAAGLGGGPAVDLLTAGGPGAIRSLVARGARFDRTAAGDLALGREAGHSRRRIVHADGDATGAEVMRALRAAAHERASVTVVEGATALDLAVAGGRVVGVLAAHASGERVLHLAPAVVLATGGIGRLYAATTNPAGVDGSGLAMAARVGARLADLEFVQFHPTALAAGADPMPLLTEALRGEGAVLVDDEGARFLPALHPAAELAPRDVVARAVWAKLEEGRKVYLDATGIGGDFPTRFPTAYAAAAEAGLDPRVDPLPVAPAAHYFMGGIDAGPDGRTSVPGLWAVGEAAATGAHGANRLASNSLLEGLVFGERVAAEAAAAGPLPALRAVALPDRSFGDYDAVPQVRALMQKYVGVVRTGAGLAAARAHLARLARRPLDRPSRDAVEVAALLATAASERTESRGAHQRADHPEVDPARARRRFVAPRAAPTYEVGL